MLIQIPVSLGELVDKITILSIKTRHLSGDALVNVQRELALLEGVLRSCGADLQPEERAALQAVNEWHGSTLVKDKSYTSN